MKNTDKEKDLDELYSWRSFVEKERIKIAHELDKYIFTFSTGILAISISFTTSIQRKLHNIDLLSYGWISLILSIIFILLSIFVSEKAFRKEVQITDKIIESRNDDMDNIDKRNHWNGFVDFFTFVGIISFVVGIAFLSTFYFKNI